MSRQEGQIEAIRRAKESLAGVDMAGRATMLGLPKPDIDSLRFRMLGTDMLLKLPGFDLVDTKTQRPAKSGDQILALHYLLCENPAAPTGELITFRDLPGGQFYWEPFLSRSIKPLVGRIGSDIGLLQKQLGRFDYESIPGGDFSAKIHCIGKVFVMLVYHTGDDEFAPDASVLFDSSIKHIYNTEDAAFLASRVCLGLL
jgi:hypothetical protein